MIEFLGRLRREEAGITGLETAIILIAFIVVASVFAYTVLSAGLFSSQKTEEVVHSGIEEAQSTLEMRGNVIGFAGTAAGDECVTKLSFTLGKALGGGGSVDLTPYYRLDANGALVSPNINECDSVWTASANVSVSTDGAYYKEAPSSNKMIIADAFTTGVIAYDSTTQILNLTYATQISAWIKSSADINAGVLQVQLCSDAAGTTVVETLDMPALYADVWTEAVVALNDPGSGSLAVINSVVLNATADPGAVTVHIDEVRTRTRGALARNVTKIAYNDANSFVNDAAWTVEFAGGYGSGTDDFLLENSEKATITVWLHNYDGARYSNGQGSDDPFIDSNGAHLRTSSLFHVQIMPPAGATLLIEKSTPAYLQSMMRLF